MTFESPTLQIIWTRKIPFLLTFFIVFTLSYGLLALVDFLPEAPTKSIENNDQTDINDSVSSTTNETTITNTSAVNLTSQPILLTIPSLDRAVTILNPDKSDIPTLDGQLLKGVVRHPDSALLGEDGNILILGHSSYLPVVNNKNFQALNGIHKMKYGETIELSDQNKKYTYRVEKVYQAKASNVTIATDVSGKRLTLVTCNNFGAKEDRYIVEATLVSSVAIR